MISYLQRPPLSIPLSDIKVTKSKSAYPDLKIKFQGNLYAVDVKSGEDGRDPWYDIGRLDTYEEKYLNKYAGEFSVEVKWHGRSPTEVLNIYIEPTFQTVGLRSECSGVLYRPYDGKLRPKPWTFFDEGKSFWRDLEHFRQGLVSSRNFRRHSQILVWYEEMDSTQRLTVRRDMDAIDEGHHFDIHHAAVIEDEDD